MKKPDFLKNGQSYILPKIKYGISEHHGTSLDCHIWFCNSWVKTSRVWITESRGSVSSSNITHNSYTVINLIKVKLFIPMLFLLVFLKSCQWILGDRTELANKTLSLFRLSDVDDYNPIMFAVCNLWFLWSISYWNSYYIPIHFFMHMQLFDLSENVSKRRLLLIFYELHASTFKEFQKPKLISLYFILVCLFFIWVEFHIVKKIEFCEKVYYRR